jgi:hypothetical protein
MKQAIVLLFTSIILCSCSYGQDYRESTYYPAPTSTVLPNNPTPKFTPQAIRTLSPAVMRVPTRTPTPPRPRMYPSPFPNAPNGTPFPRCSAADLQLWIGDNAAMGEILIYLGVKNRSRTACIVKEPLYLTIRDRQERLVPIDGNGSGGLLEEILQPNAGTSLVFSWSGCPDVPEAYWRLYGAGVNQVTMMTMEYAHPRCAEGGQGNGSSFYPSRLSNEGQWFPVLQITPTPR